MTDKPAKPVRRRIRATKPKTKAVSASASASASAQREPTHDEISERAYFLALAQGGGDELGNWLRAEAELAAA